MPVNPAYDSDTNDSNENITILTIGAGGQRKDPQTSALPASKDGDSGYPDGEHAIVDIEDGETTSNVDRADTYSKDSSITGDAHAQTETGSTDNLTGHGKVTDHNTKVKDTSDENISSGLSVLTMSQIKQRQRFRETIRSSIRDIESGTHSSFNQTAKSVPETQMIGRRLLYMKMGTSGELDAKWLEHIEVKFKRIAGSKGHIAVEAFKEALGLKRSFFAERFFELFDQDASGFIDLMELMDGLRMLAKGTPAQKLLFLFDVFDVDGSGFIERNELKAVLQACMEESSLSLTDDNIEDLTDVMFDAADADGNGMISFQELEQELSKHPGVIENLTISAAKWLHEPSFQERNGPFFRYFTHNYWVNNRRKCVFFLIYWLINAMLFAVAAAYQYKDANNWIKVARGCGLCLNFNCTFIVVLMLRKCITFIRMTKLCQVLPLDHHIMFHKHVGMAIFGFSIVHSLAHVGNAATVAGETHLEMWEILFTTKASIGYVGHSAFITGWILDIVLIVMAVCSAPFVRRSGHFQVFYWSHMLYVPFWILTILHGPHFWKWFLVPGLVFVLEKLFRSKLMKLARYGDTYIDEVNLLPSGVTHLIITRPLNFRYQPGDYVFVQIPVIAKQEWHPFTISSAPEMEGHIWLHVRSAGFWTNKLYEYFDQLKVNESTENRTHTGSKLSTK